MNNTPFKPGLGFARQMDAEDALAAFLGARSLSANQIEFVNLIIESLEDLVRMNTKGSSNV